MLAKHHKVQLRADQDFFGNSARTKVGGALIYYQPNEDHFRASVIVAKKHANLASAREKIKRQIYQIIQDLLPQIRVWKISVVIVVFDPDRVVADRQFSEKLLSCLKKIHS